jgi:hypothetical protein
MGNLLDEFVDCTVVENVVTVTGSSRGVAAHVTRFTVEALS